MNLTFDQIHQYFENRLGRSLPRSEKVAVRCPFHDDHNASATVFQSGNGGFNCHGCSAKGSVFDFEMRFSECDFQTALQNIASITGAQFGKTNSDRGVCTACYDYRTPNETLAFQKRRYEIAKDDGTKQKNFIIYHKDGTKMVTGMTDQTPRVLYNLPEVITSNIVFLCEGEKDADTMTAIADEVWPGEPRFRIATTCNFEGAWQRGHAAKWLTSYNSYFAGKQVFVFEDNDESGRTWADHICQVIAPFADTIRRVRFEDMAPKSDATDCLQQLGKENIISRIKRAVRWRPTSDGEIARPAPLEPFPDFMMSREDEIDWMVTGFIQRGANGFFIAPPKGGKSFLTADLCIALATGTPWLGLGIPKPVKTGLVSREDNAKLTRWRLDKLVRGRTLTPDQLNLLGANLYINTKSRTPTLMLDNSDELNELITDLKAKQIEIVFLDVFNLLHAADENDNSEMTAVMNHVRRIEREAGCAVAIIHHMNKDATVTSITQRMRGASAIAGFAEWIASIRMVEEESKTRQLSFEIKAGANPDPIAYNVLTCRGGEIYLSVAQQVPASPLAGWHRS